MAEVIPFDTAIPDGPPSPRLVRLVELLREKAAPRPGESFTAQRALLESALEGVPIPADVTCTPVDIGGRPAEWLEPADHEKQRTILYFHGGGYCTGSLLTIRALAAQVAVAARARTLTIDYRLAPEHPFPAAVEDGVTALRYLLDLGCDPGQIALAGDSAGGGLTVATLIAARDAGLPLPTAAVCISPLTDLTLSGASLDANSHLDPQVQRFRAREMVDAYLAGQDPRLPLASPAFADLKGLPPLLVQVGAVEALLDDSRRLAAMAEACGVDVTLECWPNMIHVWHAFAPRLSEGTAAIERIGAWLGKQWTTG